MIIGVGLDQRLGLSLREHTDLSNEALGHGYESMWTNSMSVPDAFHVCSAWSSRTELLTGTPLRTGIAVIPAAKGWNLDTLMNQAATVGQVGQGNFVLGIGAGGAGAKYWGGLGMPDRPIAIMRDYVTVLRQVLSGIETTYDGPIIQVDHLKIPPPTPGVPVYLAALGPQMLHLAGEIADGVCLNWATPSQIAWSNEQLAVGLTRTNRERSQVKMSMYIRVCIDDDVAAARRAFGVQVLGYGLARPGVDRALSYRGHFGRMGFDDLFLDLEERRANGASLVELVDLVPDEFLNLVGYFGNAQEAPARFAQLADGLDEAIVRVITARPGIDPIVEAMDALTPAKIRDAANS
jgi:alkanesulfonate monooxygenase SsuD/methylene tetrahydromethanopterin reductase-like flavin-dependent oxidoreductase (luciferase family)